MRRPSWVRLPRESVASTNRVVVVAAAADTRESYADVVDSATSRRLEAMHFGHVNKLHRLGNPGEPAPGERRAV